MPPDRPSRRTVRAVNHALAQAYGLRQWDEYATGDLVGALVATILSQNTSDLNSDAAFRSLKAAFASWDAVAVADPAEIAQAIRSGGLANQKAARIAIILEQIRARAGAVSLDFIRDMPDADALAYLRSFNGVGPKTAACVLLFELDRHVFPVDTHIFRVTTRLGWLPEGCGDRQAHDLLGALIPGELHFQMHVNLMAHGRQCCHPRSPGCDRCPIRRCCDCFQAGNCP